MKEEKKRISHISIWIILTLITIPILILVIIIFFRHSYVLTNEEVVKKIKNIPMYKSEIEYTVNNSRSEYSENIRLLYYKNIGLRIEFEKDYVRKGLVYVMKKYADIGWKFQFNLFVKKVLFHLKRIVNVWE